jgi:hypothetical protein
MFTPHQRREHRIDLVQCQLRACGANMSLDQTTLLAAGLRLVVAEGKR